jgi:hypothetical protein
VKCAWMRQAKLNLIYWISVRLALVLCFPISAYGAGNVTVDLSRIGDASHLEFSGGSDWKYDLKRESAKSDTIVLRLKGVNSSALQRLKTHSDSLIRAVSYNENGVDGAVEISFKLSPKADFFEYITEQPSRLIVDFFPKEAGDRDADSDASPKVKAKPKAKSTAKSEDKTAQQDDEIEPSSYGVKKDISDLITGELPRKRQAAKDKDSNGRKPAGTDYVVVDDDKDALPPPSLAEQISMKKDFHHGIFDGGDPEFRRFTIRDYEVRQESMF